MPAITNNNKIKTKNHNSYSNHKICHDANDNATQDPQSCIRDVWKHNLEEEFRAIRQITQIYHNVAMDTEFPGIVAQPIGEFRSLGDYKYKLIKCNVDLLRIIQLGLTFMDDDGNTPEGISTWQFNFQFDLS